MGKLLRRNVLTNAAVAGAMLGTASATMAQTSGDIPQPSRSPGVGGTDPHPGDVVRERQNPDMVNPPATDAGTTPNLRFSFADAHMRQSSGGWTRQVTARELGVSKNIAGVNMRLNAGAVRELHWHKQAEWSYMLYGSARITAIDAEGRNFVDDVGVGDLWYFPGGIPHSIQGLGSDGCEFLLVFDDGDFDEDDTFLISDWFKHVPNEVLGKNFGVPATLFGHTPSPSERYIFSAQVPGPLGPDKLQGAKPVPQSFSHHMLAQEPIRTKSGTVRITDSSVFPVSKTIAAALVEVEPGGMRELHWHPEYGRVAVLHRRPGPHGRLRGERPGANLRFSRRGCRLCAVRHGSLRREHWHHHAPLPGNVQEQLLRRSVAQPVDGADSTGSSESASGA